MIKSLLPKGRLSELFVAGRREGGRVWMAVDES